VTIIEASLQQLNVPLVENGEDAQVVIAYDAISDEEAAQVQTTFPGAVIVTLQVFLRFFNKFEQRQFRATLEKYMSMQEAAEARAAEQKQHATRRGNHDSEDDFEDDDDMGNDKEQALGEEEQ